MLRIRTYLEHSDIPGAGLGLFCQDFVPAGTVIWQLDPGLDLILAKLPEDPVARQFCEKYGYIPLDGPERWVICMDNGRFVNHSEFPNTLDTETQTIAISDLAPGTEITSDYSSFCRSPFSGWSSIVPSSEMSLPHLIQKNAS